MQQIKQAMSDEILGKWQFVVNSIAKVADVPVGLIMQVHKNEIEVFRSSETGGNPYEVGEKAPYHSECGLYCETVIRTQEMLIVPNALEDEEWRDNPDVPLGMISYLGVPVNYPNGEPFGTLCLLDSKANNYSQNTIDVLAQLRDLLESQLFIIYQNAELKEVARKADVANEAKSRFLASVSHELRTPMNAILGFSSLLTHCDLNNEALKFVSKIETSAHALMRLIDDILDISRVESGQLRVEYSEVSVAQIAEDLELLFAEKAKLKGIEFRVVVDHNCPEIILMDHVRLHQILINLIGNAIKFTSAGYVHLNISCSHKTAKDCTMTWFVEDTGKGIAEEDLEEIFNVFSQAKGQKLEEYGGTGLGLAICRKITEALNGELVAESDGDEGSSFKFTIPGVKTLGDKQVVKKVIEVEREGADYLRFAKASVLLAATSAHRVALVECLESYGFDIEELDASEGSWISWPGKRPEIIIADNSFSGISCEGIKEDFSKELIDGSLLIGHWNSTDKASCFSQVIKPFDCDQVICALMNCLDYEVVVVEGDEICPNKTRSLSKGQLRCVLKKCLAEIVPVMQRLERNPGDIQEAVALNEAFLSMAKIYPQKDILKVSQAMTDAYESFDFEHLTSLSSAFKDSLGEMIDG